MLNSLVAYKGRSAHIISQNTHKFELEFADGTLLKVREKDFRFIHPKFATVSDACQSADFSVLEDFQGETLSLQDMTEWLFDEFTAQTAWCTCLLVEDGLYFYWQKNKVFVRPTAQVECIRAKRNAEALEAEKLKSCIGHLSKNIYDDSDFEYLQEIERVALNQSKHAKILDHIKVENTPEAAYRFLLKLKYFEPNFNPYPARFGIPKDEEIDVHMPEQNRADLTHLNSYAIDNADSNDADDAISIDGDCLWVHVADVSAIVESDSELDIYAQERASNLYLPNQIIHMLPVSITQACALGISEISPALSIGFNFSNGNIGAIKVLQSLIKVTNISYDTADEILDSDEDLSKLQTVILAHKKYRDEQGSIGLNLPRVDVKFKDNQVQILKQASSPSRELVAEMMIMAGRTVAQFAQDNDIVMPYAIQDEGSFSQETLNNKDNLSLSESFAATKCFKRSATSTKPLLHYGLGLNAYLRVTSPLRRYLDLLAHQQLANFISGKPTLDLKKVKEIIGINNATMADVGRTTRFSNDHYKLLYLMQNPSWIGEAIVVDTRGDKALMMLPEIGMMTQIKFRILPKLDESLKVEVNSIDLVERLVDFKTA